jgi:hypothetical protein
MSEAVIAWSKTRSDDVACQRFCHQDDDDGKGAGHKKCQVDDSGEESPGFRPTLPVKIFPQDWNECHSQCTT